MGRIAKPTGAEFMEDVYADEQHQKMHENLLKEAVEKTEESLSLSDFEPAELVCKASFDRSTEHGQAMWVIAMNAVHEDLRGQPEFTITIRHWACWKKEVVRVNGEVDHNAWVAVWFDDKGRHLSTASLLTIKQWSNIVKAKLGHEWGVGLKVKFVPNPSKIKGGNPWYSILLAE